MKEWQRRRRQARNVMDERYADDKPARAAARGVIPDMMNSDMRSDIFSLSFIRRLPPPARWRCR